LQTAAREVRTHAYVGRRRLPTQGGGRCMPAWGGAGKGGCRREEEQAEAAAGADSMQCRDNVWREKEEQCAGDNDAVDNERT
jgi:hypothetical protein